MRVVLCLGIRPILLIGLLDILLGVMLCRCVLVVLRLFMITIRVVVNRR